MDNFKMLWQFNVEFSLLLLAILFSRFVIKKTTKHYNSYLLWLSIPLSYLATKLVRSLELFSINQNIITDKVHVFIVTPANKIAGYTWIYVLWGLIAAFFIGRLVWQHYQLRKQLKLITVNKSVANHPNILGSEKYPIVSVSQENMTPAVYGFLKPKIYFPIEIARQL